MRMHQAPLGPRERAWSHEELERIPLPTIRGRGDHPGAAGIPQGGSRSTVRRRGTGRLRPRQRQQPQEPAQSIRGREPPRLGHGDSSDGSSDAGGRGCRPVERSSAVRHRLPRRAADRLDGLGGTPGCGPRPADRLLRCLDRGRSGSARRGRSRGGDRGRRLTRRPAGSGGPRAAARPGADAPDRRRRGRGRARAQPRGARAPAV